MTDRSRRSVLGLGAGALAALAGCISSSEPSDTGTTESTTTDRTTTEDWHNYRHIELHMYETTVAEIGSAVLTAYDELDSTQQSVVVDAVENDGTTYTTYRSRPLDADTYVEYDGSYYVVRESVAAEREVTAHKFRMESISDGEHRATPSNYDEIQADAVAYEDLPEADREAFEVGFPDGDEYRGGRFTAQFPFVYESESALEDSILVSEETTYVEYEENYYAVEFNETQSVVETDYEYALPRVAETKEGFDEVAAETYAIRLDEMELSSAEKDILRTLVEEGVYERENPIPEALETFVGRLRSHKPIYQGDRVFAAYEGSYYGIRFSEAVA